MKSIKPIYGQDYAPGFSIFTRGSGIISDGIAWFESLYEASSFIPSHVLLVINMTLGIESSIGGVHIVPLNKYFDDPNVQVVCREPLGLNQDTADQILIYANSKLGYEYDYSSYVGYLAMLVTRLVDFIPFLRQFRLPFSNIGEYVCSTFVADSYKHSKLYSNIPLFREWHISRIFPLLLLNKFP